MSLPIYTTVEDINSLVNYLRTKPTGATLSDLRAVLKELVDPRKLSAFSFWGLIIREGDRLKLSQRGWDLARKTISQEQALSEAIDSVIPYRSVLEWAYHQKMEALTSVDAAAHWHEHHSEALGSEREDTIKDQAVCFFRVAEAAGLGKFLVIIRLTH